MNELLSSGSPRTMLRVSEWRKKNHTHSHKQGSGLALTFSMSVIAIRSIKCWIYHIRPTRRVGSNRSHRCNFFLLSALHVRMCTFTDVCSTFYFPPPHQHKTRSPKLCSDFLFHTAAPTQVCLCGEWTQWLSSSRLNLLVTIWIVPFFGLRAK